MTTTKAVWSVFAIVALAGSCADDGPRSVEPPGTPEHPRVTMVEMVDIGFAPR